ncbi:uncharacterized protein IL334_005042 [Kwoniella shivajii]|uniref:CASTOR ACT domain-containing protein n=1 Tax=Kwoniella shivajii TaxID=564305 RepID=A0ABZ1D5Z8_9TREE|nr:hypothetical protein IL334_005042 [Kwoniella shivajii]
MPAIVITALLDPVSIVHIPISLAHIYTTKIYWTIDRSYTESSEFFNMTSNRIEMAIFGSLDLINHEWANVITQGENEIMISNSWRVFEISSGDQDEIDNYDSPHLRHVSAPLAKAGISILYQSSYFTDFLLVKQTDFERARNIFSAQGWQIDPSTPPSPKRRSLLSPLTPSHPSSSPTRSMPPPTPEITVLPPPLACVGFSKSAENRLSERVRKFLVWPERCTTSSLIRKDNGSSQAEVLEEFEIEKERPRPFISYTRNEDGTSLVTEVRILRGFFANGENQDEELHSGGELFEDHHPEQEDDYHSDHSSYNYFHSDDDVNADVDTEGEDENENGSYMRDEIETNRFNGQTFTPPPDFLPKYTYSLPPTPSERNTFDVFTPSTSTDDESRSEYSVGEIPIRWCEREFKSEGKGRKRCLQLDLRCVSDPSMSEDESERPGEDQGAYHLDKSGLVTRFSDLLTSSSKPIRMLYSSTFHTANILVEARDIKKAKRLLERKRRSIEWK